jgi:metallo-beta-lactamase class B
MQRGRTLDSGNVVCYSISASLESLVVRTIVTVAGFFLATNGVFAQADETSRSWNKPVTPFRIAGNLYYVGAAEITSYLITTPEGHFLLDGGFATRVGRRLL